MSKLRKTSDGNMPVRASLLAEKVEGASTISVSGLAGWAQGQRQDFIICKYDSDKNIVPGSVTSWTGVPASNGTIGALRLTGGQNQQYPIGAAVVSSPTSAWANDLIDALLAHHDANGNLKSKTVTYDHIDEKTEYKHIASPNDLNDAQFLVPGKWRFGNNQQVGSTKNLPLANNTGVMETISHSGGATQPGMHAQSSVLQLFTALDGRMFIRRISTAESASSVTYGAWQEFAKGFKYDTAKAVPTGDAWINGKPIMRLTVDVGKLPNSGNKEVAAKIPKNATVVGISGVANGPEGAYPLPYVHESIAWVIRLTYNSTTQKMNVYSAGDRSGQSGYVFIDYVEA